MKPRAYEFCSSEAALYCSSDSAFLCRPYDARIHQANFLAARHLRCPLCSLCHHNPSSESQLRPFCKSKDDSSASSLSSCVSTITKSTSRSRSEDHMRLCRGRRIEELDVRTTNVVEAWFQRAHVGEKVEVASHALRAGMRKLSAGLIPIRVLVATSVWFVVNLCCSERGMVALLKRVDDCSGVPAGIVIVAERRLVRALGGGGHAEEEGWAECS